MKMFVKGGLALALMATLSGCNEGTEGGVRIDNQNQIRPALNSVRVVDPTLAHYKNRSGTKVASALDIENVTVSPSETGFSRLSVEIRNKVDVPLMLEVRSSWYDASGAPSDAAQSWSRVNLPPQGVTVYKTVSTNMTSRQYYVEIRQAR
ncbi:MULTISPECIES: DUF1425 domain-containing protein [Novosphingobium]|uniref:Uncharacterized protein YcfL n=1 Tax=Novosphingobium sediminicola TaxID=563162 RepID=A0A7W6G8J1_9SPHN|nr:MULTISPECIES: DUF1425 domain-containing protein [Novosphingobium]MBB3956052.1 uncharacterized protein YcfL [Novosphingobium sediminicola]NOW48161.1 uncharacterized protein YcfL [Novosphingobium sp. SG751A]